MEEQRMKALQAASRRQATSVRPKVTSIEEAKDKQRFCQLINATRGEKSAPEALRIIQKLHGIAVNARVAHLKKLAKRRARADKILDIIDCEPTREFLLKLGFQRTVVEMEEFYIIPRLISQPLIAMTLLETGITVLEEAQDALRHEEQARWEMTERTRLAAKGAKEETLKKIAEDRLRVKASRRASVCRESSPNL